MTLFLPHLHQDPVAFVGHLEYHISYQRNLLLFSLSIKNIYIYIYIHLYHSFFRDSYPVLLFKPLFIQSSKLSIKIFIGFSSKSNVNGWCLNVAFPKFIGICLNGVAGKGPKPRSKLGWESGVVFGVSDFALFSFDGCPSADPNLVVYGDFSAAPGLIFLLP